MHEFGLLLAGLLAGSMNALAGGGSFVALPALIAYGLPSVTANATGTVALYPGGLASALVYRDGLAPVGGIRLRTLAIVTAAGGLLGAILLLSTPTALFDDVLPWLLALATLMLAFGRRLGPALRARFRLGPGATLAVQALLGIYGGYFGGAVGLMMMAAWSVLDGADVKALNAPRTVMVSAANGAAVICFALAGAVAWRAALALAIGAALGGWLGARVGRVLPAHLVRAGTLILSVATTLAFFLRAA